MCHPSHAAEVLVSLAAEDCKSYNAINSQRDWHPRCSPFLMYKFAHEADNDGAFCSQVGVSFRTNNSRNSSLQRQLLLQLQGIGLKYKGLPVES